MEKKHQQLYESIRQVINQQGKDIIKDVRLVNILNDMISFEDLPAAKPILRDILKQGYGTKLLELDGMMGWRLKAQAFTSEIVNTKGYQRELVSYLFESLAYGLGWVNTVKTPVVTKSPQFVVDAKQGTTSARPKINLREELEKLKTQYLRLLEEGIVVSKETSGYFPATVVNELDLIKGKIQILSEALNINNTEWCDDKKQEILNRYTKNTSSLKRRARAKIAIPVIALMIGCGYGGAYLSSSSDRIAFNQTISEGDTYYANGNYLSAISSYKKAYTNYDAFNEDHYKAEAWSKISVVSDKLVTEAKSDPEKLPTAQKALVLEQTMDIEEDKKDVIARKLKEVTNAINTTVENGKNTLLLNISANNGSLNAEGKSMLKQLLKLSPDDYWLNFIKNKEL